MGLAVEDAADAKAMLLELERGEAERPLPPVMVVPDPLRRSPFRSRCRGGPMPSAGRSVKEEDGSSREGEVSFSGSRRALTKSGPRSSAGVS